MEKNNSGDGFLNFAVVGAAIILFARTADVLSYFSPQILSDIVGFDVALMYGIFTALLVEGVALALHFNRRAAKSISAQWVKWSLLGVSGVCQLFDGYVITNTLAQQTDTIKAIFQYAVPLIPLFIMVMIFGIGHLPDADEPKKPFVGLQNIPSQFDWIWYGPSGKPKTPNAPKLTPNKVIVPNALDLRMPNLEEVKPKENPQSGENGH